MPWNGEFGGVEEWKILLPSISYSSKVAWDEKCTKRNGSDGETVIGGERFVDAYDAMVSDRPYRKALTNEEAVAELQSCAGTQFDPILTSEFLALLQVSIPQTSTSLWSESRFDVVEA